MRGTMHQDGNKNERIVMLNIAYILTTINLCIILAGQLSQLTVFLAFTSVFLWLAIINELRSRLFFRPAFWGWLLFLAVVLVQIINHGGVIHLPDSLKLVSPAIKWLPFTLFPRTGCLRFATWLGIAGLFIAYKYVDHELVKTAFIRTAVMLALLGVAQYFTKANGVGWFIVNEKPFFSVFPYINNAGSFFMLAAGLLLYRSWFNLPWFALMAYCTVLTKTRAMWPVFGMMLIIKALPKASKYIIPVIIIAGFYLMADGIEKDRWCEYGINVEIIQNHPWFGVGMEGNKIANWLYSEDWMQSILLKNPNTHCDPLVFTVEYGLILSSVLLCTALSVLGYATIRKKSLRLTCANVGVVLVCCHALMDMPFRCPAVWVAFIVVSMAGSRQNLPID